MTLPAQGPGGNPGRRNGYVPDPVQTLLNRLTAGGYDPRERGPGKWDSRCPAHAGKKRNLSIAEGADGAAVLHCHHVDDSGRPCSAAAIVGALGLELSDLFRKLPGGNGKPAKPNGKPANGAAKKTYQSLDLAAAAQAKAGKGTEAGRWLYRERDGSEAFWVVRYALADGVKSYRPFSVDSEGRGWVCADPPGPLPLYHLDQLEADRGSTVFVCEGEKCADLAAGLGLLATTAAHGASSPGKTDWSPLAGRSVVFLPDAGAPGRGYVAKTLEILAKLDPRPSVRVFDLPGLADGEDIEQWLDQVPDSWDDDATRAELLRLAEGATAPDGEEADWVESGSIATLADVRLAIGEFKYTWPGWIQPGSITTFAADAGVGKTLVSLKLCEIVWKGLKWPDGTENTIPRGKPSLWLCYDRAWHGIMRTAVQLGLPDEAILLPTWKGKPLCVPDLDDPQTIVLLERLIRRFKPWAVFIDTMTYASGANVAKAHEAKLAYSPLMGVMAETGCSCLSNTHLSSEGKVLNRRPVELSRIVLKLKAPDPENGKRLRFWVDKSDDMKPAALGVTIGGDGLVAFDDAPPLDDVTPRTSGPQPVKSTGFAEWLFKYLEPAPAVLAAIIDSARDAKLLKTPDAKTPKPSLSPLYHAKDRLPRVFSGWRVNEFTAASPSGKEVKHWERVRDEAPDDDGKPAF